MHIYLYTIPDNDLPHASIPVYDEDRQTAFVLKKNSHRLWTDVFHHMSSSGKPPCYMAVSPNDYPIFKIDYSLSGVGYTIQSMHSQRRSRIDQYYVQPVEKAQTFRLDGEEFYFGKDYTGASLLTRNDEKIAKIETVDIMQVNPSRRIRIEAKDDECASLIAILYHTFNEEDQG
ncbi:MAG: hypothetical protein ACI33P_11275 [Lysinibacillus sp.]